MHNPGVGVGSVNIDSDRRLASVLGIRHRPAIAGIINGQVTDYGQGTVTLKAMRDFVDRLLPSSLIQEVCVHVISSTVKPLHNYKDHSREIRKLIFVGSVALYLQVVTKQPCSRGMLPW